MNDNGIYYFQSFKTIVNAFLAFNSVKFFFWKSIFKLKPMTFLIKVKKIFNLLRVVLNLIANYKILEQTSYNVML